MDECADNKNLLAQNSTKSDKGISSHQKLEDAYGNMNEGLEALKIQTNEKIKEKDSSNGNGRLPVFQSICFSQEKNVKKTDKKIYAKDKTSLIASSCQGNKNYKLPESNVENKVFTQTGSFEKPQTNCFPINPFFPSSHNFYNCNTQNMFGPNYNYHSFPPMNNFSFQNINPNPYPNQTPYINFQPKDSQKPPSTLKELLLQPNALKIICSKSGSEFCIQYISLIFKEKDLNELITSLSPILIGLIHNQFGNEVVKALIKRLKSHQRLMIWNACVNKNNEFNDEDIYKTLMSLINLIETKSEELSVVNCLKPKFYIISVQYYGSLLLQHILQKFNDESKYILISYIYESFVYLIDSDHGMILVLCFLSTMDNKPYKIKEGFLMSIKPLILSLITSKNGYQIMLHIIRGWKLQIWDYFREIVNKSFSIIMMNQYSSLVIKELYINFLNKVSFICNLFIGRKAQFKTSNVQS